MSAPEREQHLQAALRLSETGNHRAAEAEFTKALEWGVDDPFASLMRGLSRLKLENNAGAEQDLSAAIQGGFANAGVFVLRASARARQAKLLGVVSDIVAATAKSLGWRIRR